MKQKFNVKVLAEVAIFAAIAFALDFLQGGISRGVFFNGGSIGLAMLPVFIIAYRRGLLAGVVCGLVVSIVQMLGGVYAVQAAKFDNDFMRAMGPFFQIMLDYVLAYTVVGFAGVFAGMYKKSESKTVKIIAIVAGVVLGGMLKYLSQFLSGGLFWLGAGESFWGIPDTSCLFSFIYNGAYCIPNIIICCAFMVIIAIAYPQLLNANDQEAVVATEAKEVNSEEE